MIQQARASGVAFFSVAENKSFRAAVPSLVTMAGGAFLVVEACLLTGAVVGVSIAAPLGPSSMLCIERSLQGGLASGPACGLGVATVHLAYGTLVGFGGVALLALTQANLTFALMSGLVLMLFAFRALTRAAVIEPLVRPRMGLAATYAGALAFGLFNPLTPVLFAALSPVLLAKGATAIVWTLAGLFLGSLAWWSALTIGICYFRDNLSPEILGLGNKAAAMMLGAMAVLIAVRGYLAGA